MLRKSVWKCSAQSLLVVTLSDHGSSTYCVSMPRFHQCLNIGGNQKLTYRLKSNLAFLTWLGSMSSAALVYLFSNQDGDRKLSADGLLLAVLFSEHIYFGARMLVKGILSKIPSPGKEKERRERFMVRKRYLEESVGQDNDLMQREYEATGGEYTKVGVTPSGEKDAPLSEGLPAERFWNKQIGWEQAFQAGIGIMEYCKGAEAKKKQ